MERVKPGKVYRIIARNGVERSVVRASSGPENTIILTPVPDGMNVDIEGEIQL